MVQPWRMPRVLVCDALYDTACRAKLSMSLARALVQRQRPTQAPRLETKTMREIVITIQTRDRRMMCQGVSRNFKCCTAQCCLEVDISLLLLTTLRAQCSGKNPRTTHIGTLNCSSAQIYREPTGIAQM